MYQILSHSFSFVHYPKVKELGRRKCWIYREINNSLSILSPFHPHSRARAARPCVCVCVRGGGESVKKLFSARIYRHIHVLRRSILSPDAILSPPRKCSCSTGDKQC
jgi:hypothetical protein